MAHVRNEQMSLVAFLQAGSTSVYAGSWRHPATELRYLDSSYYADLGRLLERGCFDLMFFDDRLAMPGIYGGSVAEAVRYGARPVKLDLSVVLGVVAGATSRIGLGATYSTTYYAPYHVARTFATLDHLSGGRAAWNVVTSVNDNEAQNFGFTQHMSPTQRYDRADEFLEAVTGPWGTWDDDAMILDREAGIFADPAKVRELNYHRSYFDVRGPLTVPKSPQGRPVILQAGSSGRGSDFAARWAELIFTGDPGIEVARKHYADQKKRIAEMGRNPAEVRICPMAYAVVGESEAQAAEREQVFLNDLVHPMSTLILLSELMNYDFSAHQLDDVVTDELVNSTTGIRGLVENIRAHVGGTVRIRDLASHRATLLQGPRFVGTVRQVADQMEGIRVVDAATLVAGPLVATTLGEMGADVIKIEQPGTGDPLRTWGDARDDIGLVWKSVSRNKRCVTLDLRQEAGQQLLHRLLAVSDVIILGSRPSALARWDLQPPDLVQRHLRLVVLHVSGYGTGGPDSDKPGYGTLAEAMSGFANLVGEPDGPPALPPFMLADGVAALSAASAVLAALFHRDTSSGRGQWIDVNLIEPLARLIESATLAYDQLGRIPGRTGSRFDASAPRNCYRTSDGQWLAMSSASPRMAQRVFTVVGRPDLAADPAYYSPGGRSAHGDEIDMIVADWIAQRALAEALKVFNDNDCAVAKVYDAQALLSDRHLAARGTFAPVADPDLGSMRVQAPVGRFSATPSRIDHLGAALGAHNDAVYGGLLGLNEADLSRLQADGTI